MIESALGNPVSPQIVGLAEYSRTLPLKQADAAWQDLVAARK